MYALRMTCKFEYELVAECYYNYYRKLLHMYWVYILAIFRELHVRSSCKLYVAPRHTHVCISMIIG
jgi:hypothetical protein